MQKNDLSDIFWCAISGSREVTRRAKKDIRRDVAEIMGKGYGIRAGGAPGVDFLAVEEALLHDPTAQRIRIVLPTPLGIYKAAYKGRVRDKKHKKTEIDALFNQLDTVKAANPDAIIEMDGRWLNTDTFHARNRKVLEGASMLFAYQVSGSSGTQFTINVARKMAIHVHHHTY